MLNNKENLIENKKEKNKDLIPEKLA